MANVSLPSPSLQTNQSERAISPSSLCSDIVPMKESPIISMNASVLTLDFSGTFSLSFSPSRWHHSCRIITHSTKCLEGLYAPRFRQRANLGSVAIPLGPHRQRVGWAGLCNWGPFHNAIHEHRNPAWYSCLLHPHRNSHPLSSPCLEMAVDASHARFLTPAHARCVKNTSSAL